MMHPPDVVEKYSPDAVIGTLGDEGEDDDDEVDDSLIGSVHGGRGCEAQQEGDMCVCVFLNGRVLNVSNFPFGIVAASWPY